MDNNATSSEYHRVRNTHAGIERMCIFTGNVHPRHCDDLYDILYLNSHTLVPSQITRNTTEYNGSATFRSSTPRQTRALLSDSSTL